MPTDPDDRIEDHYTRLGTRTPCCRVPGCDERDPRALIGTLPNIVCYEHQQLWGSRDWIEDHHPAGRHNHPATIPVPGNDHRALSDAQQDWPRDTLRNPSRSPLLRAAAILRGWHDIVRHTLELTTPIPTLLEGIDQWLRDQHGDRWWKDLPPHPDDER